MFPAWDTKRSPRSVCSCATAITSAGYYRDRALVLGRGVASRELALDYFAKREGQSHGRQMPSHYSYAAKGIWSVPTPTGAQLLPACGLAWGIQLDQQTERCRHDRSAMPPRGRAISTRRFVSRKNASCRCCSSSRTTNTASAARRGRSTRARSMSSSLTTGRKSTAPMCSRSTTRARRRSRAMRAGQGPALFLGQHGAALQPHQLG